MEGRDVIKRILVLVNTRPRLPMYAYTYGIPLPVLKNCVSVMTPCLSKLFLICHRLFPSCWKLALIQPVPKKGNRSQLSPSPPCGTRCRGTQVDKETPFHNCTVKLPCENWADVLLSRVSTCLSDELKTIWHSEWDPGKRRNIGIPPGIFVKLEMEHTIYNQMKSSTRSSNRNTEFQIQNCGDTDSFRETHLLRRDACHRLSCAIGIDCKLWHGVLNEFFHKRGRNKWICCSSRSYYCSLSALVQPECLRTPCILRPPVCKCSPPNIMTTSPH